jgi:hypothetical protein
LNSTASAQPVIWKAQEAMCLANGVIELIVKTEGGHLAELRFLKGNGAPSANVLWEAPWRGRTRSQLSEQEITETAGITGHGLCLDYFGPPSAQEAAIGGKIHGEAATFFWDVTWPLKQGEAAARWKVELPIAGLSFERVIHLGNGESVAYVEEQVTNKRNVEHICDWVQHVTFGPSFMSAGEATFAVSGTRGLTAAKGYEGQSRVAPDRQFQWPFAPSGTGNGAVTDLRQPFTAKGTGTIATVQLDLAREVEYLIAVNWKLRLGVGYCFRRRDFPWMIVWEENGARQQSPWNGTAQARGMEFGTTPFPFGRADAPGRDRLFDTESWCTIPAGAKKTARYVIFLFQPPGRLNELRDVSVKGDAILLYGKEADPVLSFPARGCEEFLSTSESRNR